MNSILTLVALVDAILDHFDKIASIVSGVLAVITFAAARRRAGGSPADASETDLPAQRWWTSRRLRVAAGISVLVCATIVVRGLPDGSPAANPQPGELKPGAAVPAQYRSAINAAARGCDQPGVTPALVAAILSVESNFDPGKQSPETKEYGIAMWSPEVFEVWAPKVSNRTASYFNPDDAISAMGPLLCELSRTVGFLAPDDPQAVIAAGYRVGGNRVREAQGVPVDTTEYVTKVRAKVTEYGY